MTDRPCISRDPDQTGPERSAAVHPSRQGPATDAARRFVRDEDGALIFFGLLLMFLMAMIGGVALDVMRFEQRRTLMQQTLDRSVLAAANLSQKLTPKSVVQDYFTKAGLFEYLGGVTAPTGLNYRKVDADAKSDVVTFLMHTVGIDTMKATAAASAEQKISNVEVSLVLDISGSMDGSRITDLRPAATEFVDTVMTSSLPGRVTMSVVPYAAQVNIGKPMMDQFKVTDNHTYSYCMELPDSVFTSTLLSRTTTFKHNASFTPYINGQNPNLQLHHCSEDTANIVLPMSDSATALKAKINGLTARGDTAIDIGAKWGTLLLDKSAQPVIQGLIAKGVVKTDYSNRPLNADTADVLKVMVLMTDGENTKEYIIKDPYNKGASNVYQRRSNGSRSFYYNRPNTTYDYFVQNSGTWEDKPDGGTSNNDQLDWSAVWDKTNVYYYSLVTSLGLTGNTNSYATYYNQITALVSDQAIKNTRLKNICDAAKAKGVRIYGIGYEAPSTGRAQLKSCVTEPSSSFYFDAADKDGIARAFRTIASNISQLRLTQ